MNKTKIMTLAIMALMIIMPASAYETRQPQQSVLNQCTTFPCVLGNYETQGEEHIELREKYENRRECLRGAAENKIALIDSLTWYIPREFGQSNRLSGYYRREQSRLYWENEKLIEEFEDNARLQCNAAFRR